MLRLVHRLLLPLATVAGVLVVGGLLDAAAACDANGDCGGGGVAVDGHTVTVRVSGSFVQAGSAGSGATTTRVAVPVPCYFTPLWTGKEYYQGIQDGTITGAGSEEAENGTWKPAAGYEQHKDDEDGVWWSPVCRMLDSFETYEEFAEVAGAFFDAHDMVYVEQGGAPPTPPVPPELLLWAAQEATTLPEPRFDWNPTLQGTAATVVNLDTWFWVDSGLPREGEVTASAGPDSVTLTLGLTNVQFVEAANPRNAVVCDGGGTPYAAGLGASECVLRFDRPTPGTSVRANARWDGSWTYNGAPQGDLPAISATWEAPVAVDDIQSVVTRVGR